MILQREKTIILNIYTEKSLQTANIITNHLTTAMLEKDPLKVALLIHEFDQPEEVTIGVVGRDGMPVFNTDITVPEKIFTAQKEILEKSDKELIFFKPLRNESRCYGCHNPEDKTRGMIVIKTSMRKAQAEVNETARRLIFFAVLIGLISEIFLIIVLRKMILIPLHTLNKGAEILKAGRLNHRINLKRDDEIGTLVSCFNEMAESIEKSHINLEDAVRQRTKDLRIIADLSLEVLKGDLTLKGIIEQFLNAITDQMGYGYSALCLIDKETGLLLHEFKKGIDNSICAIEMLLVSDHPFAKVIREAKPVIKKSVDIGVPDAYENVAMIPLLSHQRKRCREVNLCTLENCPAFNNPDERCWLISDTLCRSPQAVAGKEKIYGCLHCDVFPVLGVLIAGKKEDITKTSLHSLEILTSEITSAIENQRSIESKKEDISSLIKLHDISIEAIRNLSIHALTQSIVSSATVFANMDAAILYLKREDERLHLENASNSIERGLTPESIPIDGSFIGKAIVEERAIETVRIRDVNYIDDLIKRYGFLYTAAVPLKLKGTVYGCLTLFKKKDFFMTDSEKAIIQLFASQAAAAIHTASIYEALRESEERYRELIESAKDVVFRLSTDGILTSLNPAFETITGWSQAEWLGKPFIPIIHPDDLPFAIEMFQRVTHGKVPTTFELRVRTKSDGYVVGEFTTTPQLQDEKVIGVFGIARDITERKRSEEELKRLFTELGTEKEFSDAILSNMSMGVMVLDREGRIIRANPAAFEILKINDYVINRMLKEVLSQASDFLVIDSTLGREIEIQVESTITHIGFSNSSLLDINEEQTGTIVVFRDLTEIKKLQAEIRKKQHFEAMGKVIAGVAHEIRNPLFGISSIVQILEREIKSEQHHALLQAMLREIYRLKNLIEELLLYSRPSKLNIVEIDFNILIEKIKHYINAKKGDVILDVKIQPLVIIKADIDKLTQVFLNLIDNAIGAGSKRIDITAEKKDTVTVLTVKDNGIGIKNETIDKIFDPFFTTKKEGTGLGLSICKKIIEDHGGDIEIQSVAGKGTTVIISFKEG